MSSYEWAAVLALAVPAVSVALTELALRLRRGGGALASPVALVRDLILPVLALLAVLIYVVGFAAGSTAVRLTQTLLWLFVIHTALSFVSAIMFARAREGSWQAKMPRLFIDMARGVIVLVCLAVVLSTVWDQNLGQLVAALGVGSLVLGLALQEPVGNLFSGIMVMMERPMGIGDWVKVGDSTGRVIESNWRSVHLRTPNADLVVVPNSVLAKGSFVNYSRPTAQHFESVLMHFACEDAPNKVKMVLKESARRTQGVLADPAPKVRLADYADSCIDYEVKLAISEFGNVMDILEEFRTLVWYASRREGLSMPYPTQRHILVPEAAFNADAGGPAAADAVKAFPHLGLEWIEVEKAMSSGLVRKYARGERVVREGQPLAGLHLIVRGRVSLSGRDASGRDVEIARLERGEFFGEKTLLTDSPSEASVTALEDVELLVLDKDAAHELIERTPALARQISEVMRVRRAALRSVRSPLTVV